jgi:hypothetical protein
MLEIVTWSLEEYIFRNQKGEILTFTRMEMLEFCLGWTPNSFISTIEYSVNGKKGSSHISRDLMMRLVSWLKHTSKTLEK